MNNLLLIAISFILYAFYKYMTINYDYFEKLGISHLKPSFLFGNMGSFLLRQETVFDFSNRIYTPYPGRNVENCTYFYTLMSKFQTLIVSVVKNTMYKSGISSVNLLPAPPAAKHSVCNLLLSALDMRNNIILNRILGLFDMRKPTFSIRDPEMIKQMTVKDFEHFEDHRSFIDEKSDIMFGNSLIMLKGNKWRDMRATLSPAFTSSKMRQMFELVAECTDEMSEAFKKQAKINGFVDCEMKDLFSKYTNDVISSAAFGYKVNSFEDPNNEFYLAGKKFMEFNTPVAGIKFLIMQFLPKIAQMFDISFTDSKVTKFFRTMVLGNMDSREKQGLFRPDMINILMNVKKGTTNEIRANEEKSTDGFATVEESVIGKKVVKRVWTDDELVAQCFLFFLAGFDTSSTLLSFLSHELTVNTDIQQRLYEEVKETHKRLNGKRLTYDALQKMKYMDMVISETLRFWPPAATTDRVCVKDYEYNDGQVKFKFQKGLYFFISIYGFHHDEKYWQKPEVFDPERFSDANKDSIQHGTYMPFGIGPRNCIGSRFALMEAKAVVYYLLLNFTFDTNEKTQLPLKIAKYLFSIMGEKGVNVRLTPRKS